MKTKSLTANLLILSFFLPSSLTFSSDFDCLKNLSSLSQVLPDSFHDISLANEVQSNLAFNQSVKRHQVESLVTSAEFSDFLTEKRLSKFKGVFIDDSLSALLFDFFSNYSGKQFQEIQSLMNMGLYSLVHREFFISILNTPQIKKKFLDSGVLSSDFISTIDFSFEERSFLTEYVRRLKDLFDEDLKSYDFVNNFSVYWKYYLLRELYLDQEMIKEIQKTIDLHFSLNVGNESLSEKIKFTIDRHIKTEFFQIKKNKKGMNETSFNKTLYAYLLHSGHITLQDISDSITAIIKQNEVSSLGLSSLMKIQGRKKRFTLESGKIDLPVVNTISKNDDMFTNTKDNLIISNQQQMDQLFQSSKYQSHLKISNGMKQRKIKQRRGITTFIMGALGVFISLNFAAAADLKTLSAISAISGFSLATIGWIITIYYSKSPENHIVNRRIVFEENFLKKASEENLEILYSELIKVESLNSTLNQFDHHDKTLSYFFAPRKEIYSQRLLSVDQEKYKLTSDIVLQFLLEKRQSSPEKALILKKIHYYFKEKKIFPTDLIDELRQNISLEERN